MYRAVPLRSAPARRAEHRPRTGSRQDFCRYATLSSQPLEYTAEDFAADLGGARLVVGHHAARRRDDGDAEPVINAREVCHFRVDASARFRNPRNLSNDRLAVDVFQLDFQFTDARTHRLVAEA